jgi:uncharacterized protein (DUF433 family)
MILPEFLVQDPDGFVHISGHRIGLHHVIRCYQDGYSPEMLLGEFPTLSLALIHKVLAFYLENRSEVDAYLAKVQAEFAQQAVAAPQGPDLAELRRRMQAVSYAEAS